jgi:secretion/DNA translocation related TadE-like protein
LNDERGSVALALGGTMFAVLVLGIVVAGFGQVLAARFQASTAADAAALAAAPATFFADPHQEAARLAGANGARLIACECAPDRTWAPRTVETLTEVDVDVVVLGPMRIRARGRAEYVPGPG